MTYYDYNKLKLIQGTAYKLIASNRGSVSLTARYMYNKALLDGVYEVFTNVAFTVQSDDERALNNLCVSLMEEQRILREYMEVKLWKEN